jgi:hypothetical protein
MWSVAEMDRVLCKQWDLVAAASNSARTAARFRHVRRVLEGCGGRDVRPPSDGGKANKKPAADVSARAFDISCDDGLIHLICPTCQV